ncbi:class I adenylate-forming enzyme family protein [Rhodococcus artemisiae]|uniref:Class I adenylate-forming enzyme family protein n=1 Tax=Rhodococcus artemisiae TaxID=714159 RepID=A0ABU7LA58_9NOCA|nr:class I adenylate-forming enzyme family protein [Rhodococcus artemisiae]MEE2058443.1 class I adenylate-forming enzyme family protein [Rhodococcus artemisiae]
MTVESTTTQWGTSIEPVVVDGRTYRMYTHRPRNLGSLLSLADRWNDRAYIVQGNHVVTFAEFHRAVRQRAAELRARGVTAGDRVVILGWNSPEWIVNFWAAVAAGGVAVLANAWWSESELADSLDTVAPRLVVADDRVAGRVPSQWSLFPWDLERETDSEALVELPTEAIDENSPAAIIFTSGTSGRPKAAVLSHRSLLAGLQMLLHITRRLPHQVSESTGQAALHTGPMFHVGGVQTLLRAICVGDTLVMPAGKFDAAEAMRLIEQWRIQRWSAVPTMVSRVLEHPDVHTRNLTTLKSLTVGGAPMTPEFVDRILTGLPGVEPRIATGYGLTENGGQGVAASGADTVERPGTTGRALPCVEIRIAPSTEFTDGEILLRSPTQMLGYLGESESPIDSDGWLHTGDLGRLDDDGFLWITGRSKDMIIRGGENIAPAAVEAALTALPDVADAVVFGIPHSDLGEDLVAAVVLTHDRGPEDLAEQLRGRIASFAIPSRWIPHREPFPVNHAGKIDKKAVVAAARQLLEEAR